MNKEAIFQEIISVLTAQVEASKRAAKAAYDAATDPGSKAENKYDTRSLESSYLARGQALRVAETEEALAAFKAMGCRMFAADQPVGPGALAVVRNGGSKDCYFIGPGAGGTEVVCEGVEVLILTPSSPLGQVLVGKRVGDAVALPGGRPGMAARIEEIV